ncbi:MAG TPA: SIS domain-containing protein [Sandaracinaceae bacterium LLY-WYZ-13_1]|nr:SIS domain-containing protein [Sandaracinaceae bacterium LLY-WYZ-13_1]
MSAPTDEALVESLRRKQAESAETAARFVDRNGAALVACARALAAAFDDGARLFVMGNGGSACDALHLAVECMHPIVEKRPALPALALGTDPALTSAIGNDRDFALAFADQLEVLARPGDVAFALSTSGKSRNVTRALKRARERGLLTVGVTGKDGGQLPELCDHCFVVPSYAIHRIQETHGLLLHLLWDTVHVLRGEPDVLG